MKLQAVSLCAAALFALLPINANAQRTVTITGGATDLTLSSNLSSALSALDVKVGFVSPTAISGKLATFPVTTGVVDLDTLAGSILHSGGLTFENGSTKIRLQSLIIDTAARTPSISAVLVVNNSVWGRYTVFDITPAAGTTLPIKPSGNTVMLKGVKLTLHSSLSAMLNKIYGVSQFTPGFDIGTANITTFVSSSDWVTK